MTIKLPTSLLAGETLLSYAPEMFLGHDQPAVEMLHSGHWILWGASLRAEKPTDDAIGAQLFLGQAFTKAGAMGLAGRWTWREGTISRELPGLDVDATEDRPICPLLPPAGEYVALDVERPVEVNLTEAGGPCATFCGKGTTESWDRHELTQSSHTAEASTRLQLRYAVALANAGALLLGSVEDPTAPVLIARSNGTDTLTVCGVVMPME